MKLDFFYSFLAPATPLELAVQELVEAERAKLLSETGKEWAEASVTYNTARIKRLKAFISAKTKEQEHE